jgi:hypothetical protein
MILELIFSFNYAWFNGSTRQMSSNALHQTIFRICLTKTSPNFGFSYTLIAHCVDVLWIESMTVNCSTLILETSCGSHWFGFSKDKKPTESFVVYFRIAMSTPLTYAYSQPCWKLWRDHLGQRLTVIKEGKLILVPLQADHICRSVLRIDRRRNLPLFGCGPAPCTPKYKTDSRLIKNSMIVTLDI